MAKKKVEVEIGLKNNEFNSKVKEINSELKGMKDEIRIASNELVTHGKSLESLGKQYGTIAEAVDKAKKKVSLYEEQIKKEAKSLSDSKAKTEELKKAKEDANDALKRAKDLYGEESEEVKKASDALQKANKAYQQNETAIKGAEKKIESYKSKMSTAQVEVSNLEVKLKSCSDAIEDNANKFKNASEKLHKGAESVRKCGEFIDDTSEKLLTASTAILTAGFTIGSMSNDFEVGLAKINTLANKSADEIEQFGKKVIDSSNDTGIAVGDYTDAIYNAISAGIDYSKSTEFIEKANKVAVGGFGDLSTSADLLTQILNIYGGTVEDVEEMSDKLFLTQEKGVLTVGELSSNMSEAMSTGKAYNVNLENLLSSYASLTKQGESTATAQTKLVAMFGELGDSGSDVGEILTEKTGKSFADLMGEGKSLYDVLNILYESVDKDNTAFLNLFGSQEAGIASMALLNQEGKYFKDTLDEMSNSAGKCDDAYKKIAETGQFKLKKSLNELKNAFTILGEGATPMIEKVTDVVKDLAEWISKLDPEIVETTLKTAGWVAGLSLLGKGIGGAVSGVGNFVDALGTISGWLGKLVGGSKGATDAVGGVATAVGKASGGMGGLASAIGGTTGSLSGFSSIAGALFNPVTGVIAGSVAVIGGLTWALEANEKALKNNTDEFINAENKYESFKGRVETDGNWWQNLFGEKIEIQFSSNLPSVVEEAKGNQENLLSDLSNYYKDKWQIDHDGCTDEEEHHKHRQELEEKYAKVLNTINEGKNEEYKKTLSKNKEDLEKYLVEEKGMTEEGAKRVAEAWERGANNKLEKYNKNFEEIKTLTEKCNGEIEKLDADSQARLQELLAENTEIEVDIINSSTEDRLEIMRKENLVKQEERVKETKALEEQRKQHEEFTKNMSKAYSEQQRQHSLATDEKLKNIDKSMFASEREYLAEVDRINKLNNANMDFTNRFSKEIDARVKSGMNYSTAHSSAFRDIISDLQNGKINVEKFGMSEEQYMAMALDAMIEAGAGAGDLERAIKAIPAEKRANVLANVSNKSAVDNLKWSIDNIHDKTVYVSVVGYENAVAQRYSRGGYMTQGIMATGGFVQDEGVYLTNERNLGFELIDTPNNQNVRALQSTLEGDYAYLPFGTQVYSNLSSVEMMKAEVKKEVARYSDNITSSDLKSLADTIIRAIKEYSGADININNDFKIDQVIEGDFEEERLSNNISELMKKELRRFGKIVPK